MGIRSGARRFRLHFFDDTGMAQELRRSLYFGIWSCTIGGLGTVVTTGAAWSGFQRNVLGANDFQIGLIAAIPVAVSIIQLFISYLMERKRNRRFLFLFCGIVGRLFWLPVALVPYVFASFSHDLRIWLVIVFVVFISGGNSIVNLGFGSLMGDLVPMRIRGQYFSVRQKIFLVAAVLCGLLVSKMIDVVGDVGYTIALLLAGVSTVLDIACYFFVQWPPMAEDESRQKQKPLFAMLRDVVTNKPFMCVVLFFTCWQFAANVANPFYNIYLIENLRMDFTQISLYTQITSNIFTVLFVTNWGRLIDRYGNKPILQIVGVVCIVSPLPWLFATPAAGFLIALSNMLSGTFWPAIDLAQQNLYLAESPRLSRSMYIAVFFACINLFGVALGNAVGGYLMQTPFMALGERGYVFLGVRMTNSHYMFLLTISLRLVFYVFLLPILKEEGAWKAGDVLRDLYKERRQKLFMRRMHLRAYILRTRARRRMREQPEDRED